jgi:signal peptidase II
VAERVRPTVGLLVALLVFLFDQVTKYIIRVPLDLQAVGHIDLSPIFDLTWVENRGISLGLFTAGSPAARWALVVVTGGIALAVAWWLTREPKRGDQIALGMILGGALGNILDRAQFGYVVDFADLHFGEWRPFLVFNVADAAISLGVLVLIGRAFLVKDPAPARVRPSQGE